MTTKYNIKDTIKIINIVSKIYSSTVIHCAKCYTRIATTATTHQHIIAKKNKTLREFSEKDACLF